MNFFKNIFLVIAILVLCFVPVVTFAQTNATQATGKVCENGKSPDPRFHCCRSAQGYVLVQCTNKGGGLLGGQDAECNCCGNCKISSFQTLAETIARTILGFTGSLALGAFIYGGFVWVSSAGNADRVKKGQQILTGAVIGVIIVLGAWLLIDFVLETLRGGTGLGN